MAEKKYTGRPGIALVIFGMIMVYIIFFLITFLFKKDVKIYEVTSGKVVQSLVTSGMILRSEEIGDEQASGSADYVKLPGSKVKAGDYIYYKGKSDGEPSVVTDVKLEKEDNKTINELISSYRSDYDTDGFKGIYNVSSGINTLALGRLADNDGSSIKGAVKTDIPGYVVYYIDGYEGLTENDISSEMFEKAGEKHKSSDKGYKMVTSDIWNIYVKLSDKDITEHGLKDKSVVYVDLKKADSPVRGNFEIIDKGGVKYGKITLNKYVMLYSYDRTAEIEISSSAETGLQVPNTAIVAKEYYEIPDEYMTKGGNSSNNGFLIQTGNDVSFKEISDVIKKDGKCFVKKDFLNEGSVLVRPDSDDRYTVDKIALIDGVYCVNAGYTDFYPVELIQSNREYSLVAESQTGLSIYDRILLQAAGHEENEVVF